MKNFGKGTRALCDFHCAKCTSSKVRHLLNVIGDCITSTGYPGKVIIGVGSDVPHDVKTYLDEHDVDTKVVEFGPCTFQNYTWKDGMLDGASIVRSERVAQTRIAMARCVGVETIKNICKNIKNYGCHILLRGILNNGHQLQH